LPISRVIVVADSPGASGPEQGLQRLGEVARADALEVQPRDQLVDALVFRRYGGRIFEVNALPVDQSRPAVVNPGHLDLQRSHAGEHDARVGRWPLRTIMATAVVVVRCVSVRSTRRHFGLDGLDASICKRSVLANTSVKVSVVVGIVDWQR
jgi:hypothetical protein